LLIQSGKKLLEVNNPLQKWDSRWPHGADATKRPWPWRANSALLCGKFATEMGPAALRAFGYNNKAEFVEKKLYVLRSYP
jgi:hypothetical protein